MKDSKDASEGVICLHSLLILLAHRGFCGECGTVLFNHVSEVSKSSWYKNLCPGTQPYINDAGQAR